MKCKSIVLRVSLFFLIAQQCFASPLFDLDSLTEDQRNMLWHETEKYAVAAGALTYCYKSPDIEARVREAARDCVTSATLDKVAAFYRDKLAENSGEYPCTETKLRYILDGASKKIDLLINDIRKACKFRKLY